MARTLRSKATGKLYCFININDEAPEGNGLSLIDVGGTGCMMIARRVIEKIQPPFERIMEANGTVRIGADYNFCVRAIEAGFKIFADWDCRCQHIRPVDIAYVDQCLRKEADRSDTL